MQSFRPLPQKRGVEALEHSAPASEPPSVVELAATERSALALAGEVPLSCPAERRGGCSFPWVARASAPPRLPNAVGSRCSPRRGRRLFCLSRESPRGVFSPRPPPEEVSDVGKGLPYRRRNLFPLFHGSAGPGFEEFCVVECTRHQLLVAELVTSVLLWST